MATRPQTPTTTVIGYIKEADALLKSKKTSDDIRQAQRERRGRWLHELRSNRPTDKAAQAFAKICK